MSSVIASIVAAAASTPVGSNSPLYTGNVIPNAYFNTAPVERITLSKQPGISEQQLTVAAAGDFIPFGYGRVMIGAKILQPKIWSNNPANGMRLLLPCVLGLGPIGGLDATYFDDRTAPAGVTSTVYLGTASQGIDPSLASAWLNSYYPPYTVVYADTMPGVAYVVLLLPSGATYAFQNIRFIVRMSCVYNPMLDGTSGVTGAAGSQRLTDNTTWTYDNNPSLALAHFLSTKGIGPEETLDWQSVADCAAQNTTDGRSINLMIDTPQLTDQWEEVLRSYAGVIIDRSGPTVRFVADAPASSVYTFTNAAPANYVLDSLDIQRRGRLGAPTLVTVKYTDTSKVPWAEAEVTEKNAGVDDGSTPWMEQVIQWPGCQSATMAKREAIRRINEFNVADTSMSLIGLDEAIYVQRGDVVSLTDGEGFTLKQFRVTDCFPIEAGRWRVSGTEYQDGLYSAVQYNGPVTPDTTLPDPYAPPTPGAVTLAEVVVQKQGGGLYESRIQATWAEVDWPFIESYRIDFYRDIGGTLTLIESANVSDGTLEWMSSPVIEGYTYRVLLSIRSTMLATGSSSFATLIAVGKGAVPGDAANVVINYDNGDVVATWDAAVDIDITGYEVRVGETTDTWATAIRFVVRVTGLSAVIKGLDVGTWRVFVKALDSVRSDQYPYGQESANAVYEDVTIATRSFVMHTHQFVTPTLSIMTELCSVNGKRRFVSAAATTFMSAVVATLSTLTDVLAVDQSPAGGMVGGGYLSTEQLDLGSVMTVTVNAVSDVTAIGSGSPVVRIFYDAGGGPFSVAYTPGGTITARYVWILIKENLAIGGAYINGMPAITLTVSDAAAANTMKVNTNSTTAAAADKTASEVRSFLDVPTKARALMLMGG